jgi:hypothetical protein
VRLAAVQRLRPTLGRHGAPNMSRMTGTLISPETLIQAARAWSWRRMRRCNRLKPVSPLGVCFSTPLSFFLGIAKVSRPHISADQDRSKAVVVGAAGSAKAEAGQELLSQRHCPRFGEEASGSPRGLHHHVVAQLPARRKHRRVIARRIRGETCAHAPSISGRLCHEINLMKYIIFDKCKVD